MKRLIAIAAIVVGATATIAAQANLKLAQTQKANAAALRSYEWKSRTEIQKDGETKRDQLSQVSYDAAGNLQQRMIASSPEPDIPKHGLRGLVAQNKKKEFMKKLEDLRSLVKSYNELDQIQMKSFLTGATMVSVQNMIRLEGRDVLYPGDSMTMWFDAVSYRQRRIEISTVLDDKPVRIVSEFQDVSQSGPTYVAKSQVNYHGSSLVILTENFDYVAKRVDGVASN